MYHRISDGSGMIFGPQNNIRRVDADSDINGSFQIKQGEMMPSSPINTEEWLIKMGEDYKESAPTLYAIAQELKAIKKVKQMEEILNVHEG